MLNLIEFKMLSTVTNDNKKKIAYKYYNEI